jgi:hypothetical protein
VFAADAVGYGESMGMRVDVVTGRTLQERKISDEEQSVDTNDEIFELIGASARLDIT